MKRDIIEVPTEELQSIWVREFNEDGVIRFMADLSGVLESGQEVCPIYIDSYGGDIYSLMAMVDLLTTFEGVVVTIVIGKAMSCGAALFSCGDHGFRFVGPHATLMLHDVSGDQIEGKVVDQATNIAELQRVNKLYWSLLEERLNIPRGSLLKKYRERGRMDWYLTPKEAVKMGLASKIGVPSFETVDPPEAPKTLLEETLSLPEDTIDTSKDIPDASKVTKTLLKKLRNLMKE